MMRWFGPDADAPFYIADLERIEPPLGQPCSWCHEPIVAGEYGITMPHISDTGVVDQPRHDECQMRAIVGSVAHQNGICTCADPNSTSHDPPGLTRRQAAQAAASLFRAEPWRQK